MAAARIAQGLAIALAAFGAVSVAARPAMSARVKAPEAANAAVTIVNRAHRPINEVYVSPVSNGDWGADRLGEASIGPGHQLRLRLDRAEGCRFDLQVVYDDARHEERHDLDLCRSHQVTFDGSSAMAPAALAGAPHPVTIVNQAGRPIQQVLISPADSGDWGDDLLTDRSLSVGERATLSYRGSCLADVRIVFDNRSAEERHAVDVCALHGIAVHPGWTTADVLPPLP